MTKLLNKLKFNLNYLLRKLNYFIKNQAIIVISLITSLEINNITFVLNTILIILFYAPLIYIFNFFFYIYFFYYCYESYLILKKDHYFNKRKKTLKFNYILLKFHIYAVVCQDNFTKILIFSFFILKFKIIIKILLFKYISSMSCFLVLYVQAKFIKQLFMIYGMLASETNETIKDFSNMMFLIQMYYKQFKNISFFAFIFLILVLIFFYKYIILNKIC
jgi:hypothetical protein